MTYFELWRSNYFILTQLGFPNLCKGIWRLLGHEIISWGWAYNNIPEIDHDDLFNFLAVEPIIGHIALFSLPRNCSLIWMQKVLQSTGIVFPHQPLML